MTAREEPIRASTLAATVEWRTVHPGAEMVWEQDKDEELGLGLVDFDPSASVSRWFQVADRWTAVADGYRQRMAGFGWVELEQIPDRWWRWTHPDRPADTFDLVLRRPGRGMFWPGQILDGMTVFDVRFVRSGQRHQVPDVPAADAGS